MNNDQIDELIIILGEEIIESAFKVTGEEKISFASLRSRVRKKCIIKALHLGESFAVIAKRYAVSRMTVYRIFHEEKKFKKIKGGCRGD